MRTIVRSVLLLLFVTLTASPLLAQRKARRDPGKISQEELAELGNVTMAEIILRARPNFLQPTSLTAADQAMTGVIPGVLVYLGTQMLGDTAQLRFYKGSDIKEVRYYKPTNALSPHMAGNAYVIQLVPKERLKP